jgi:hypothetical protein
MSNIIQTQQSQPISQALVATYLTPNLPSWVIPIAGVILTIVVVDVWPTLYTPIVIGLIGIILLWLTQPYKTS